MRTSWPGILFLLGFGLVNDALADGAPGLTLVGKEVCHIANRGAFRCQVYRNEAGKKYYLMNGVLIDESSNVALRLT